MVRMSRMMAGELMEGRARECTVWENIEVDGRVREDLV